LRTDETGTLLRSMTVMQDSIRTMVEREKSQRRSAQTRLAEALESSREGIIWSAPTAGFCSPIRSWRGSSRRSPRRSRRE
jgi:hypothetical protein